MLSILNRTILWELVKIFLLALVSITGILLLAVVVIEAQNQGLGPLQILVIIPLVIPSTLPYTIPATTLFATCVVYGRLAGDNEILALKAAGINLLHILKPAVLLGLAMSVTTGALYYQVIPMTYHMMKTLFLEDVEGVLYGMLKRRGCFIDGKVDYVMYVKRVEGKKLINAQFMHRDSTGRRYDIVARAREAELLVDMAHRQVHVHMRQCFVSHDRNSGSAYLADKVWDVDLPTDIGDNRKYRRTDMTWEQLLVRQDELREKVRETEAEVALTVARQALGRPPDDAAFHLVQLREMQKFYASQLRDMEVELQRRPSLALGCLCFVLVGCPVGMWFSRSDYLSAFVTCFLPIVLLYYPLVLCGENLARAGALNPVVAVWLADGVMGLIAIGLYRKLIRN